jgi:hypothetical protein
MVLYLHKSQAAIISQAPGARMLFVDFGGVFLYNGGLVVKKVRIWKKS